MDELRKYRKRKEEEIEERRRKGTGRKRKGRCRCPPNRDVGHAFLNSRNICRLDISELL